MDGGRMIGTIGAKIYLFSFTNFFIIKEPIRVFIEIRADVLAEYRVGEVAPYTGAGIETRLRHILKRPPPVLPPTRGQELKR